MNFIVYPHSKQRSRGKAFTLMTSLHKLIDSVCLLFSQVFLPTSLPDISKGGNALSIRTTTYNKNEYMHMWMVACGSTKLTNPSTCPPVGTTTCTAKLPSSVDRSLRQRQSTTPSSLIVTVLTGLIPFP